MRFVPLSCRTPVAGAARSRGRVSGGMCFYFLRLVHLRHQFSVTVISIPGPTSSPPHASVVHSQASLLWAGCVAVYCADCFGLARRVRFSCLSVRLAPLGFAAVPPAWPSVCAASRRTGGGRCACAGAPTRWPGYWPVGRLGAAPRFSRSLAVAPFPGGTALLSLRVALLPRAAVGPRRARDSSSPCRFTAVPERAASTAARIAARRRRRVVLWRVGLVRARVPSATLRVPPPKHRSRARPLCATPSRGALAVAAGRAHAPLCTSCTCRASRCASARAP